MLERKALPDGPMGLPHQFERLAGTPLTSRTACRWSSQCQQADAFVYLGADVDVHSLFAMQENERRAVFIDILVELDGALPDSRSWTKQHAEDPRRAFRVNTMSTRVRENRSVELLNQFPNRPLEADAARRLERLLMGRMRDLNFRG